jgi:hypothetical protein
VASSADVGAEYMRGMNFAGQLPPCCQEWNQEWNQEWKENEGKEKSMTSSADVDAESMRL